MGPTRRTLNERAGSRRDRASLLIRWLYAACMLLPVVVGCDSRPSAPVLRDAPVYQNDAEGFRFLVPQGWLQTSSATLPPERLEGEVVLVQYRMRTSEKNALVEVLCFDREEVNLEKYHAEPSHGVPDWRIVEPLARRTIHGVTAEHCLYRGTIQQEQLCKEVFAFRRGPRVYSFIAFYWESDQNAREEVQRAMESIVWREP